MTTKEAIRDAVTLVLEGKSMTFGQLDEIREELENKLGLSLDIVTAPPSQMSPRFYNRIKQDEVLLYEA